MARIVGPTGRVLAFEPNPEAAALLATNIQLSLPDCVLVDIEGWEIAALLGARRFLAAEPFPMLIIELHPDAWAWSGHSRHHLEALLKRYSLHIAPLSGQHDPLSQYGQVIITRLTA